MAAEKETTECLGKCIKCGGLIFYDYGKNKFKQNPVDGCRCKSKYPDDFILYWITYPTGGYIEDAFENWQAGREAFMDEIEELYSTK